LGRWLPGICHGNNHWRDKGVDRRGAEAESTQNGISSGCDDRGVDGDARWRGETDARKAVAGHTQSCRDHLRQRCHANSAVAGADPRGHSNQRLVDAERA
jgi:hypothetical protein